ncbi:MAG: hypothetical protein HJJLKODD_01803 [Phycisphaerae bacterium]|nr:hypothetical protein [Phycisphaerae bacterium]
MAGGLGLRQLWSQSTSAPMSTPTTRARNAKSLVVSVYSRMVIGGPRIRYNLLTEMLSDGLCRLTQAESNRQAWSSLLQPEDVIGIKFDPIGEDALESAPFIARWLVESLVDSGWPVDRIVLIDGPLGVIAKYHTQPMVIGFEETPVQFGSGEDRLAKVLKQITALINIPSLKDDNVVGLGGCLRNLVEGSIQHPARFYANRGSPFFADIVSLPEISGRLRLNLVNALATTFSGGPLVDPVQVEQTGLLIFSTDPVAADVVALDALNSSRVRNGLLNIELNKETVPIVFDASERGLGQRDYRRIERKSRQID